MKKAELNVVILFNSDGNCGGGVGAGKRPAVVMAWQLSGGEMEYENIKINVYFQIPLSSFHIKQIYCWYTHHI